MNKKIQGLAKKPAHVYQTRETVPQELEALQYIAKQFKAGRDMYPAARKIG